MSQQKPSRKSIGSFFRSLLETFTNHQKKTPLPQDIPPLVIQTQASLEKSTQPKEPEKKLKPVQAELSAKEYYQLGLNCFEHQGQNQTQEDQDILAFQNFQKAAQQEHPEAQSHLAYMYQMGYGTPKDSQKSFQWGIKAAQQGIAEAQYHIGLCYMNGWGTIANQAQAIEWLKKASEQGITQAHRHLADIYSGYHALVACQAFFDINLAEQHYLYASQADDLHAQLQLAKLYLNNTHQKQDITQAKKYLSLAVKAHNEEAHYLLGTLYLEPEKGLPDYAKAAQHFYNAAQNSHPQAMYELGKLYALGQGVNQDKELSKRYYQLAAATGHRQAKQKLYEDFDIFADEKPIKQNERVHVHVNILSQP